MVQGKIIFSHDMLLLCGAYCHCVCNNNKLRDEFECALSQAIYRNYVYCKEHLLNSNIWAFSAPLKSKDKDTENREIRRIMDL